MFSDRAKFGDAYPLMLVADIDHPMPAEAGPRPRSPSPANDASRHRDIALQSRDNVFFALYPDPGTAGSIARLAWYLRDKHGLRGWPIGAGRLHVSLHGLGDYARLPDDAVAAIGAAVKAIAMPPFLVGFNRAMSFRGASKRPLVLLGDEGIAGLAMFQHELVATLRKIGFARRREPPYNPHVTLLYDEGHVPEQAVEETSWAVREFALVRSLHGRGHMPLARWRLRG
jgi:2'-5' RNA ligase